MKTERKTSPQAQSFRKRMEFNLISCEPCIFPLRLQALEEGLMPSCDNSCLCQLTLNQVEHWAFYGRLDISCSRIIWSGDQGCKFSNVHRESSETSSETRFHFSFGPFFIPVCLTHSERWHAVLSATYFSYMHFNIIKHTGLSCLWHIREVMTDRNSSDIF